MAGVANPMVKLARLSQVHSHSAAICCNSRWLQRCRGPAICAGPSGCSAHLAVLLRLFGLDIGQSEALLLGSGRERRTEVFGAVARREEWVFGGYGHSPTGELLPSQ